MKNLAFIGLLLILFAIASQAQSVYSKQNLEQASQEDFNLYLEKAQNLKKIGAKLSIGGPITSIAGLAIYSAAWAGFGNIYTAGAGVVMFFGGIGITLVGLPILITGASRVKRINNLERNFLSGFNINLTPDVQYNQFTQNYQSGLKLSIRF